MLELEFGRDYRGRVVRANLSSLFIFGGPGSGKSSTAAVLLKQAVDRGAELIIGDPDARHEQSLVARLGLAPDVDGIAMDTDGIAGLIQRARSELDVRQSSGRTGRPLVVAVDEWMRSFCYFQAQENPALADLEAIVTGGRKYAVYAVLISHGVTASSNVPPWIRDVTAGVVIHRVVARVLHLALGVSRWTGADPATLPSGQAIVRLPDLAEPVVVTVPKLPPPPKPRLPAPRRYREQNVGAIMGALFADPARHYGVRELGRRAKVAETTAIRLVAQLVKEGRLTRYEDGVGLAPWTQPPTPELEPAAVETLLPRPPGLEACCRGCTWLPPWPSAGCWVPTRVRSTRPTCRATSTSSCSATTDGGPATEVLSSTGCSSLPSPTIPCAIAT